MKLYELLKAGKKATLESSEGKWYLQYEVDEDEGTETLYEVNALENEPLEEASTVVDMNEIGIELIFSDRWIEHKEKYKTNFDITKDEWYFFIDTGGEIFSDLYSNHKVDMNFLKNFNAFEDEKLAEYIQAKQLLERKLMVFSYLNGANEIDWEDVSNEKYFLDYFYSYYGEQMSIEILKYHNVRRSTNVYFKSEEIANKALELYRNEIEKVIEMGKEFGF